MIDFDKKPTLNRSVKERRKTLFFYLDQVLGLSHKKIHCNGNSDSAKRGWARLLIQSISTYGRLLEEQDLETRVIELEEKFQNSLIIPKS